MWHLLNRSLSRLSKLPVVDKVIPRGLRGKLRPYLEAKAMRRLPDRVYMERSILPALSGLNPQRVLFVGVERYTKHYAQWFTKAGTEYWTLDIRPEVAQYGAACHKIGSVIEADKLYEAHYFDQVFLNGVFGWGVNERSDQETTISALRAILKPDGILVLGWNDHRVQEPMELEALRAGFTHGVGDLLPKRVQFQDSTHVYDFCTAQ